MEKLVNIIQYLKRVKSNSPNWKSEYDDFLNKIGPLQLEELSEEIKEIVAKYQTHFDFYVEDPKVRAGCPDFYDAERLVEHIDNFFSKLKEQSVDVDAI